MFCLFRGNGIPVILFILFIGSSMNGIVFRSFQKRHRSQKNTNTIYSVYSYSGTAPKERALSMAGFGRFRGEWVQSQNGSLNHLDSGQSICFDSFNSLPPPPPPLVFDILHKVCLQQITTFVIQDSFLGCSGRIYSTSALVSSETLPPSIQQTLICTYLVI